MEALGEAARQQAAACVAYYAGATATFPGRTASDLHFWGASGAQTRLKRAQKGRAPISDTPVEYMGTSNDINTLNMNICHY